MKAEERKREQEQDKEKGKKRKQKSRHCTTNDVNTVLNMAEKKKKARHKK